MIRKDLFWVNSYFFVHSQGKIIQMKINKLLELFFVYEQIPIFIVLLGRNFRGFISKYTHNSGFSRETKGSISDLQNGFSRYFLIVSAE